MAGQINGWGKKAALGLEAARAARAIYPPWLGYPLSGCSSAEPDSVSPSGIEGTRLGRRDQDGRMTFSLNPGARHARPSVVRADFGDWYTVARQGSGIETGGGRGPRVLGTCIRGTVALPGMRPRVSAVRSSAGSGVA